MALTRKALDQLIVKIRAVLKTALLEQDPTGRMSVTPEHGDNVHILIISNLFKDLSFSQRDNIVWPILENALEDHEIVHISLCLLLTPDEALVGASN